MYKKSVDAEVGFIPRLPEITLAEKYSTLTVYTYLKLGMQIYLSVIFYLNW